MFWTICPWSEVFQGEWCEDHYREELHWTVAAIGKGGVRLLYVGPEKIRDKRGAELFAARVQNYHRDHVHWTPLNSPHWNEIHPVYGSDEYQRQEAMGNFLESLNQESW